MPTCRQKMGQCWEVLTAAGASPGIAIHPNVQGAYGGLPSRSNIGLMHVKIAPLTNDMTWSEMWSRRAESMDIKGMSAQSSGETGSGMIKFTIKHLVITMGRFDMVNLQNRNVDGHCTEMLLHQNLYEKTHDDSIFIEGTPSMNVTDFQTYSGHISEEWKSLMKLYIMHGFACSLRFFTVNQLPAPFDRRQNPVIAVGS